MNRTTAKEVVWLQVLYLFIIPVILLYFGIIPGAYRFVLLLAISLLLIGIVHREKWTFSDVGIHKDWFRDWVPYLVLTIAGAIFLVSLYIMVPHFSFMDWDENRKFLLLFIPISVLQEVLFRGILMKMLLSVFSHVSVAILVNALLFCLLHVIYIHAGVVLPLTFIAGLAFAAIYAKYPNLVLVSFSHIILNFMAMVLGFFALR